MILHVHGKNTLIQAKLEPFPPLIGYGRFEPLNAHSGFLCLFVLASMKSWLFIRQDEGSAQVAVPGAEIAAVA